MLKHVGRLITNGRKVIVAYRVVPNEPENCVVVTTENLNAEDHDALMKVVESASGQDSNHLADAMARTTLPDGRNMLASFHKTGKMVKLETKQIEMTPTTKSIINLAELNQIIAEQEGVTVAELAPKPATGETAQPVVEAADDTVLSNEDLAAQYRSQADALFKEAKALREQAEELVPTKKKAAKEKSPESA